MRLTLPIIIVLLICSCKSKNYKTIDFEEFVITVPANWNRVEISGMDSYIGGIITDKNDTLSFDYGWYSNDISKDFPMVYDNESILELTQLERKLLPNTKHLIVDDLFHSDVNYKDYLKYNVQIETVDCYTAKLITPRNKGYGGTGIYIDSLNGSRSDYNKNKLGFYGWYLSDGTQKEFLKALKTIKFPRSCH